MLYVVGRTVPVGIKITASACEKSLTENSSSDFFFVSSGDIVYFSSRRETLYPGFPFSPKKQR